MKKGKIIGGVLFLIGVVLILNSFSGMTGFVVASNISGSVGSILGIAFIIGGVFVFMAKGKVFLRRGELRNNLISRVKEDETIYKLSKKIKGNTIMQNDINHLIKEFAKGNTNPGIGTKKLYGNISYLRGDDGGRVFYRPSGGNFEILAYAIGTGGGTGKSQHERRVIKRLEELYR